MNSLSLFGDVLDSDDYWLSEDYFTPRRVKEFLNKNKSDVHVEINSPGGSYFAGVAIYNLLNQHAKQHEVKTSVVGIAASAASVIALAGEKREIHEGAMFFIHNPIMAAFGNSVELRKKSRRS